MILLDTGVLLEAMKPQPEQAVRLWLDAQKAETLFISSVSVAELLVSLAALPQGKAKDGVAKALDHSLQVFANRVVTFNTMAAWSYADLCAEARKRGRSYAMPDAYIGAIAAAHGLTIASRNTSIFEDFGLLVINPWAGPS